MTFSCFFDRLGRRAAQCSTCSRLMVSLFYLLTSGILLGSLFQHQDGFGDSGGSTASRRPSTPSIVVAAFDTSGWESNALVIGQDDANEGGREHYNRAESFFAAPIRHHAGRQRALATQAEGQRAMAVCLEGCGQAGRCSNGVCICDQEPTKGYWIGRKCDACMDGYAGEFCKDECPGGSCNQCNGHGKCSQGTEGNGECTCVGNWDGEECMDCKPNFRGAECEQECPGADKDGSVCYGRGDCVSDAEGGGKCDCQDGWGTESACLDCDRSHWGDVCQKKCVGYMAAGVYEGLPCSGHGTCFSGTEPSRNGTCVCTKYSGYGTADCSIRCPVNSLGQLCSGHGKCNEGAENTAECKCWDNFAKPDCQFCLPGKTGINCDYECPKNPNTGETCSLVGKCVYDPHAVPLTTNVPGISTTTPGPTAVPSSNASNTANATISNQTYVPAGYSGAVCRCAPGYTGRYCGTQCDGDPPCNGHGTCATDSNGTAKCMCYQDDSRGYWTGTGCDRCSLQYNQSKYCTVKCPTNLNTGEVCSGRGHCAEGYCYCFRYDPVRDFCGRACEYSSPATPSNSSNSCTPLDMDNQTSLLWPSYCPHAPLHYGPQCKKCKGYHDVGGVQTACNEHGYCAEGRQAVGNCTCKQDWVGTECDQTCASNPATGLVCSGIGRGRCSVKYDALDNARPFCECQEEFAGEYCQLDCPVWGGEICAGHGNCFNTYMGNASCNCTADWTGKGCSVPCACNTKHGRCEMAACYENLPSEQCEVCNCFGNFSAAGLCDTCRNGTQGSLCEGDCIHGSTLGRTCVCHTNYSLPDCSKLCAADDDGVICGGHGSCVYGSSEAGLCQCDIGPSQRVEWFRANCTKRCTFDECKAIGLANPQCSSEGLCECLNNGNEFWAGKRCDECVSGYSGARCRTKCPCNDHGSCNKATSTDCVCYRDSVRGFWDGPRCDACADGFIGVKCEQKNIRVSKVDDKNERGFQATGLLKGKTIDLKPRLLAVDMQYQKIYAGAKPGFKISTVGADMATEGSTDEASPFKCGNTTTTETFFASVQWVTDVTSSSTYTYFLQQPLQSAECNRSVVVVRVDRNDPLSKAEMFWECKESFCQNTSRIVAATEKLSRPPVYRKLLVFVIQQTGTVEGKLQVLPGGHIVRLDLRRKQYFSAPIPGDSLVKDLAIRDDSELSSPDERYAVAGVQQVVGKSRTWDLYIVKPRIKNGSTEVDGLAVDFSFRQESRLPCWSNAQGDVDASMCGTCVSATRVHWNGGSIVVGFDAEEPTRSFLAWFLPIDRVNTYTGQMIVSKQEERCKPLSVLHQGSTGLVLVNQKALQQVNPMTYLHPQWYVMVAPTNIDESSIESMAYDPTANVTYVCLSVFGGRPSVLAKVRITKEQFALYGTSAALGFVTAGQLVYPKTFSQLAVDPWARVVYGLVEKSLNLRIETFLLYEITEVTPNVADQREGTNITIRGSGFLPVPKNPSQARFRWKPYEVLCRFGGEGSYKYSKPIKREFNEIICAASQADNGTSAAGSCSGQPIEVSLYGERWFTQNAETIKRVPSPRIVPPVVPDRGPLQEGPIVTIMGSGFVASASAVCKFYSNNSEFIARDLKPLLAPMIFVSPNMVTCQQPDSEYVSYDPSLLDVLIDGQQSTISGPAIYQIVGPATNLTSAPQLTIVATRNSSLRIDVYVVDIRYHHRSFIDTVQREVKLLPDSAMNPCAIAQFSSYSPYLQGNFSYPVIPCRPLVVEKTLPSVRLTDEGEIRYADLYLIEPRKGTVRVEFTAPQFPGWKTVTTVKVVEGEPVGLMIANFGDLMRFDASESTRLGFLKGTPIMSVKIILIDELANLVEHPGNRVVTAHPFEVIDGTNDTTYQKTLVVYHRPEDGHLILFSNIILNFYHGIAHFINFTSGDLRPVLSPPLRTALCDVTEYKVPLSEKCELCPAEGAVCNGTETVVIIKGYWRGNSTTDIYKCEEESLCHATASAVGANCRLNHTGVLCNDCVPGYGKSGKTCTKCPPETEAIAIVSVAGLGFIIGLCVWTVMTLRKAETTDLSVIMRTVVNHMQATGKLGEFSTEWGALAKKMFSAQSSGSDVSISGLASMDCLLRKYNKDYGTIFGVYMVLPALSFGMAFLVYVVVRALKLKPVITPSLQEEIEEELKHVPNARSGQLLKFYPFYYVFITTFCVHMFAMYQTFITQSTIVLKCRNIVLSRGYVDGELVVVDQKFLAVDTQVKCDDDDSHYFRMYALMAAIGYGVGIPVAFVAGYVFINNRLEKKELTKLMFLFLIGGYKDSMWFWQALIMLRKLALVLIIVFIDKNKELQAYMGMWSMALSLILQILFEPNLDPEHNLVEALSLCIIVITLNLGLLYLWDGLAGPDNEWKRNILTVLLAIITVGAMAMFAFFMFKPIKAMVFEQLKMLKQKYRNFKEGKKDDKGRKKLRIVDPVRDRLGHHYDNEDEYDGGDGDLEAGFRSTNESNGSILRQKKKDKYTVPAVEEEHGDGFFSEADVQPPGPPSFPDDGSCAGRSWHKISRLVAVDAVLRPLGGMSALGEGIAGTARSHTPPHWTSAAPQHPSNLLFLQGKKETGGSSPEKTISDDRESICRHLLQYSIWLDVLSFSFPVRAGNTHTHSLSHSLSRQVEDISGRDC